MPKSVLVVLLALVFAGCSDDGSSSSDGGTADLTDGGTGDVADLGGDTADDAIDDTGGEDASDQGGDDVSDQGGDDVSDQGGDDVLDQGGDDVSDLGGDDASDAGGDTADVGGDVADALDLADFDADDGAGGPTAPGVGELVITELMPDPAVLFDDAGEWFEIYNPSATVTYELEGCVFESDGAGEQSFTVGRTLEIAPESYLTFSRGASPGFTPDYPYGDGNISLNNNSADALRLRCDAGSGLALVDSAAYEEVSGSFNTRAVSLIVDPTSLVATANDEASDWCASTSTYNTGGDDDDYGTPGAINDDCLLPSAVSFCRLESPVAIDDDAGAVYTVLGRVEVAGWTDIDQEGNDEHPLIWGSLGYGAADSAPDTWTTWTAAFPNPGWNPVSASEPTYDEYTAELTTPVAGDYDYAYRFSGNGGIDVVYCDQDAGDGSDGSEDGYQAANAGQMTVAVAAPPDVLISEYVEGTGGTKAIEIANLGADAASLAGCALERYSDGGDGETFSLELSGSIAAGDVYVVCYQVAPFDTSVCDVTTGNVAITFDGDDALAIVCGDTIVDSLGDTLGDPGVEWNVNDVGTQNETLVRLCSVTEGDDDLETGFDPSAEWVSLAQDTVSGLGSPECCYLEGDAEVTFVYNDLEDVVALGESVYLAGEFNGWNTSSDPLTSDGDGEVFSVTVSGLSIGSHEFKLVVNDGSDQWDWLNTNNRALDVCADVTRELYRNVSVGWANLESPGTTSTTVGNATEAITGQVYINNVTNPDDEGRGLVAEIGFGAEEAELDDWTWEPMDFASQNGNNDLFSGTMTPESAGTFRYATRYSGNAGLGNPNHGWTYGDLDGLASGGFTIEMAGTLTVTE